jgi:hypothetical protein
MAVKMVALVRSKNGEFVARKGIPVDVREAYARFYGVKWEAQLKLPAGTPKHEAKTRHGEWLAEVENRIATLRATVKGEGQPLTRLNAIALAGQWYTWFVAQYEADPGVPKRWRDLIDYLMTAFSIQKHPTNTTRTQRLTLSGNGRNTLTCVRGSALASRRWRERLRFSLTQGEC